jgi:hypothetical protein
MMGSRRRGWRRRVVLCGERVMTTFTKKEMFCLDCIGLARGVVWEFGRLLFFFLFSFAEYPMVF